MRHLLARIELAPCPAHPVGSRTHYYLLDIPQPGGGSPRRPALARRFRPGARDLVATLERQERGWAVRFVNGPRRMAGAMTMQLPLTVGDLVTVTEPEGETLPYVVTEVSLG